MIEMRRAQLAFGDGLIAEEVSDLRDHWMEAADQVLADEEIVAIVYEALRAPPQEPQPRPQRRAGGGGGTPAHPQARAQLEL